MPSPPIAVFLTTIASQPALRQRQEYILRTLQVKKIPFTSYDLASDEDAKRLWKRKAPLDKQQLPGILVGGDFPGTFQDFEEAVEFNELDRFLRLSESWKDNEDSLLTGPKLPPAQPIGVPGAMLPLQMTPEHLKKKILAQPPKSLLSSGGGGGSSSSSRPTPVNKRQGVEVDLGDELSGFGLQGVKVMEDELLDMVKDLGLDDAAAGDLVKGLSGGTGGKSSSVKEKNETKEGSDKQVKVEQKEDQKVKQKVEERKEEKGEEKTGEQAKDTV